MGAAASEPAPSTCAGRALRVLAVGDVGRGELATCLAMAAAQCSLEVLASPVEAAARLAAVEHQPDLIVLVQARPGEISCAQVDALRRAAPLARLVGLLGAWCEGELRSGNPWPGVLRVYWHTWPLRWDADRKHDASGRLPSWAQPETSTEEDRIADLVCVPPLPPGRVAVWSLERDLADWLHDAALALGQTPVRTAAEGDERVEAELAIWDCPGTPSEHLDALHRWVGRVHPARVLVLAGFPRWHDVQALLAAGAACVAPKPLRLDELAMALRLAHAATAPACST